MNAIQSTAEYRSMLHQALEQARRALPARDFSVVARGLVAEITRLDQEIENLRFRAFMGFREGAPLFPRVAQFVQRSCARLLPEEETTIPLETKDITRFALTSRRSASDIPFAEPSLSMGLVFAKSA
jgi:hypothetical protein